MFPKPHSTSKLIAAILLCQAASLASGYLAGASADGWFEQLNKPIWNPPFYLFAPVWTLLYLLMGFSLWLVWISNAASELRRRAIFLFASQLLLNFLWSIIFFRWHSPAWALIDIVLLIVLVTVTIFLFARISKPAARLLVPYIAWVCFAALLNYSIWSLNS
ncbi:MAG: TspO/MBR family protein [Flavobacteriales bacterium]